LAGVATEDKLEQARALLQTISGKDFATQTTLAQVKSELELVKAELQAIKANQLRWNQKVTLSDSEDLAQDVTVQGVKSELEEVTSELELVKAELQAIKANQLSGNQKLHYLVMLLKSTL